MSGETSSRRREKKEPTAFVEEKSPLDYYFFFAQHEHLLVISWGEHCSERNILYSQSRTTGSGSGSLKGRSEQS